MRRGTHDLINSVALGALMVLGGTQPGRPVEAAGTESGAIEVTGTITYRFIEFLSGVPTPFNPKQFRFRAIIDDQRWFFRTEPVTNQANTFDYCEVAFDGTNQYAVKSIKSWVEDTKALGRRVGSYTAFGMVWREPVVHFGYYNDELGPLWLAYASAGYFRRLTDDVVYCPPITALGPPQRWVRDSSHHYRVRVSPGPAPGVVPAQATFLTTNALPPDMQCLWWSVGQWRTSAVFTVQHYTNLGRFTVPLQAVVKTYAPYVHEPRKRQVTLLEWSSYEVEAATVRPVPAPAVWCPELPEPTRISDYRFADRAQGTVEAVSYQIQGRWYTDAEVMQLPDYPRATSSLVTSGGMPRAVRAVVAAGLLAGAVVYYLVRKRRSLRAK